MGKEEKESVWIVLIAVLFLCFLFFVFGCAGWYRAGVQSEVYRRAGVEVTQWECFIGMKPAERAVILK